MSFELSSAVEVEQSIIERSLKPSAVPTMPTAFPIYNYFAGFAAQWAADEKVPASEVPLIPSHFHLNSAYFDLFVEELIHQASARALYRFPISAPHNLPQVFRE